MKTPPLKQPRVDRSQPPLPLFDRSLELVCGVDEAGRGPLAGPVFAAAVILNPERPIEGLRDSKKLTAARREALALEIREHALSWAIAACTEAEIDTLNILHASMLAMRRAIDGLHRRPTLALIDGNRCPVIALRCDAIIQGDDRVAEISAASILAKTARDAALLALHAQYPQYAFDQHKGYPTPLHLARLRLHGVSPVHRRTYAPVRSLIDELAAYAARPAISVA
jgi:ribonuclease HII